MQALWDRLTIRALAMVLALIAAAAVVINSTSSWLRDWTPNVATEALSLLLTIAVVDRIVGRRQTEDARVRVEQALRRVSGGLHALADFLVWDYDKMHQQTYQRPPNELRALLEHWREGLETRDTPWLDDPATLTATETISKYLDQQIQRHERVLDHTFVAAGYRYMRAELMSRKMYRDEREHHDENGWKRSALSSLVAAVLTFLDVFEPYARQYLGQDWSVTLRDDAIDYARRVYGPDEDLADEA